MKCKAHYFCRANNPSKTARQQKTFLYGTLLGDGYIRHDGRLVLDHSTIQRYYVEWKFAKMIQFGWLEKDQKLRLISRKDNRTKKTYNFLLQLS